MADLADERTVAPASLRDQLFRFIRPGELRPVRAKKTHSYRPDVDGLRAIAVIAVMLFHGGMAGFSGGFVGVDIFFVISGFLIGRIVLTKVDAGTFTFAEFYDRRVRRILPPLFLVILATLVIGWFLLLPRQLKALGYEALTATSFISNIWFWRQAGYFHPEARTQPLLHTWSLAIEEQFYLFFPAMIAIAARISRRHVEPIVAAVLVVSLATSVGLVLYYPSADFFLLPTRTWELMAGVLLASGVVPKPPSRAIATLAALIALPFMFIPILLFNEAMPFPGAWAVVPTAGTALAIWAGLTGNRVSELLATRLLVFVGLLSYSLYLWHWPVYVALHHATASAQLSAPAVFAGMTLSFLLALFSVRVIEGPFRDRNIVGPKRLYVIVVLAALVIAAASISCIATKGAPGRLSAEARLLGAGADDFSKLGDSCRNLDLRAVEARCRIGAGTGPATFVLWGDSHAAAITSAVSGAGKAANRTGLLIESDGCYPVAGYSQRDMTRVDRARCIERGNQIRAYLLAHKEIRSVVLVARWHRLGVDPDARLIRTLAATADQLRAAGKKIIVLGGVPVPDADVPWTLATASRMHKAVAPFVRRADSGSFYDALAGLERDGRLRPISLAPAFCGPRLCRAELEGRALFSDDNHISDFAARRLVAPYLERAGLFDR